MFDNNNCNLYCLVPLLFSIIIGHANEVSSRTSRTSFCCRPALSARAIPSARPAIVTPAISCSTKFIFDAFPTSPVEFYFISIKNHRNLPLLGSCVVETL